MEILRTKNLSAVKLLPALINCIGIKIPSSNQQIIPELFWILNLKIHIKGTKYIILKKFLYLYL